MSEREDSPMNKSETERQIVVVECIAPEGLGFGEGGISVKSQIEQGILTPDTPRHIYEFLTTDTEAFKQVETDDDGCGDGRPWIKIVRMIRDNLGQKKLHFFGKSKLRAKVFGGGLVVASSMWRAINGVPKGERTVGDDRKFVARKLEEIGFKHGAHSDDHAEGDNCGCGAIDKYPVITANAVKYRQQITGVLESLYGEEFEDNRREIEQTFGVYEALAKDDGYFADASGRQSMEQIIDSGAVVKELAGHHVEETIVINGVEGTTLDQQFFTETIKNAGDKERPRIVQAFSVDTWRGRVIADKVAEIAQAEDPAADYAHIWKLAYADFLIRTLAVAGTLTAGDLPVYRRQAA